MGSNSFPAASRQRKQSFAGILLYITGVANICFPEAPEGCGDVRSTFLSGQIAPDVPKCNISGNLGKNLTKSKNVQ
ncbi:hypothetical protein BRYFOR_05933 [Marvinbryantia formatexigens DSM 14469]|uniref:Uncharacterized protein n=1 Tax=Marvinbryantia formatexigens DSM 14469 TaxID=478749 RepID=C6LBD8_9FIRM|nr:hypothetical protein [Marvinbryantia formatexigens]EET62269.1 hypothetical protein BRYFOR_05933 [Marvinbryantia formatexigens DSM 14469]